MKISISLTEQDVGTLDALIRQRGLASRSAVVQQAVRQLAEVDLDDDYLAAYEEWEASGEAGVWAATTSDGLGDASR